MYKITIKVGLTKARHLVLFCPKCLGPLYPRKELPHDHDNPPHPCVMLLFLIFKYWQVLPAFLTGQYLLANHGCDKTLHMAFLKPWQVQLVIY